MNSLELACSTLESRVEAYLGPDWVITLGGILVAVLARLNGPTLGGFARWAGG